MQRIGICPKCCKNRIYENEKYCPDCLEYFREANKKSYQKVDREAFREKRRNLYNYRKSIGICTICGSRKALPNRYKCVVCTEKAKSKYAQTHEKIKRDSNLCLYCDNERAKGLKICEYHRQINIRNAKSEKAILHRQKLKEMGIV